ncbi:M23 family metallopeptidase [Natronosporangium hydrolyticum]|uniref:M23 family metallopeptidase n=1 Tax=Natronosporangium hydrolyticum TaxID=2811111 RepID=UPI0030845197
MLHPGGVVTRYCHLLTPPVEVDDQVTAGQPIGQVGSSGNSSGPRSALRCSICASTRRHLGHPLPASGPTAFALWASYPRGNRLDLV